MHRIPWLGWLQYKSRMAILIGVIYEYESGIINEYEFIRMYESGIKMFLLLKLKIRAKVSNDSIFLLALTSKLKLLLLQP